MNIKQAIAHKQQMLINRAKTRGIYENFGQKEVRELEDKYIIISSYSNEMNEIRALIERFDSWCQNYTGDL